MLMKRHEINFYDTIENSRRVAESRPVCMGLNTMENRRLHL